MMKKFLLILLFLILAIPCQAEIKKASFFDKRINKTVEVTKGEIIVRFKPSVSAKQISAMASETNVQVKSAVKDLNINRIRIPKGKTIEEMLEIYSKDPKVEYAEPSYIRHAFTTTPNDPSYSLQWGLPKIKADKGWDVTTGESSVIIAIVDSGIDLTHPDLQSKLWSGIGYDFVNNDSAPEDEYGHGTHVAGIAAAATNNGVGIAGCAWNCKIMVVKMLDATGSGNTLIESIDYAVDNGAKVINLSLGGPTSSQAEDDVIQKAHNTGCVITAAASNDGTSSISYPAGYSNVIGVGSTDSSDSHSGFSNHNSSVDVCAPGENIYSTQVGYSYGYMSGTSMSAPFVSGLAALLFSSSSVINNTQVENRIISYADDLGAAGRDDYYGYGRINVYNSLQSTITAPPTSASQISVRVYPNPFRKKTDLKIFFDTLTGSETIRIYNLNGQLIKTLTNTNNLQVTWDGKTESGSLCDDGIYFYLIIRGSLKKVGKIAIIQ